MNGVGHPLAALLSVADALDDAVLMLDAFPVITHANSAAARLLGDDSLVGQHPAEVLGTGFDDLLGGAGLVSGPVRRPAPGTGSGLTATVVAVRDRHGQVLGSLVVLRDLVRHLHNEQRLEQLDGERAALLAIMDRVSPGDDLTDTVRALCDAIQTIAWVDGAMIMLAPGAGRLVNVTRDVPPELGLTIGAQIPTDQLEFLISVTQRGPWYLDLGDPTTRDLINPDLLDAMRSVGFRASAYAAIRSDDELIGVLSIASIAQDAAQVLAGRLGSIQDLAHLAGAVIRNQAVTYNRSNALRSDIDKVIDTSAFTSVFQPILDLGDGRTRWYEALTRFTDGTAPDVRFAAAREAGLEEYLEEATARAALDAAATLPLSVNFSPRTILGGVLTRLGDPGRPLVVEVTEHARTGQYAALREALAEIPWATVAVDDAGAGYARLRHILELRPQYVKLDIGLVNEVDTDPARAAMVAGVRHFAQVTGTLLVAEGIERQSQADTLRELGVDYGQGFLFGRPGPLPS